MSELINICDNRTTIRWKLLTSASALALTAYVSSATLAKADDTDRPTLWIELGGQMDMMQGLSSPFTAPFMFVEPVPKAYGKTTFTGDQAPPRFAFGGEGKITFQPEGSDWIFSASIRYGRSHTKRHTHDQLSGPVGQFYTFFHHQPNITTQFNTTEPFHDTKTSFNEHHTVLDFSVGKDVGMGFLGRDGSSNISAGVRLIDLGESSTATIYARPKVGIAYTYPKYAIPYPTFHQYTLAGHTARSFRGIGPSLSWNASTGLAGNAQDGELMLDWGINVALIFGRQKAKTDHRTHSYNFGLPSQYASYVTYIAGYDRNRASTRSRKVTVPNVGGFAGLSVKYPNFKFSVGYRVDTFFDAIDTGIDAAKKSNLTFNGPYASISVGLGD